MDRGETRGGDMEKSSSSTAFVFLQVAPLACFVLVSIWDLAAGAHDNAAVAALWACAAGCVLFSSHPSSSSPFAAVLFAGMSAVSGTALLLVTLRSEERGPARSRREEDDDDDGDEEETKKRENEEGGHLRRLLCPAPPLLAPTRSEAPR